MNNPIRNIDPDGRGVLTDYFNKDGKKIGTDGINNGARALVENKDDVKKIENATKNGGTTQISELSNVAPIPNNGVLQETLNVIARGAANGGLREESSVVGFSGMVYQGETGPLPNIDGSDIATASASLPNVPLQGITTNLTIGGLPVGETSGVSIHLHPTESLVSADGQKYYSFTASSPTIGVDNVTWQRNGYSTNIIAGRLGTNANATVTGGKVSDSRPIGAAFYIGGGTTKPTYELTTKAIQNIIKTK